jgi:malate dehydrogenase (oxaloacetate-decarboxylating)(NADP+)
MDTLHYHEFPVPGKIEVMPTKSCKTQQDLSFAYTPGVAEPCLLIQKDPRLANRYTSRGNLVAVITNGTAVLGLGDIGALAGKPVMEGKGVLFKRFADVDVFDIEINTHDVEKLIETVTLLEPTFGGINLEDIKAPECFVIERRLKKALSIPVFHDDQHGTAIISGAGLINALEISGKKIGDLKVVVNGAGAAGIACSDFYVHLGIKKENIVLCDTKGVVYKGRMQGMNEYKEAYAVDTKDRTLADAVKGADMFLGLSVGGALTPDMLKTMNKDPIVFACANPDPEIHPREALAARSDVIISTGRSDYPNQVNNVLGFPFIFRGALDVEASDVNEEMKMAASRALAAVAREPVTGDVLKAYNLESLSFGRQYIIPKPFDRRVFFEVSIAVAEAAVSSGVARAAYPGRDGYRKILEERYARTIARFHE